MKPFSMLCVALALSSGSLLAQTTFPLQGTLKKTTDHRPVDFANVLLRSPKDSTLITGAITDSLGKFRIEVAPGKYLLEIRALGLQAYHKTLTLSGAMNLGELLLNEEATQLSAVQVTGKRPIMLRKADRMVFDATQIAPAAKANPWPECHGRWDLDHRQRQRDRPDQREASTALWLGSGQPTPLLPSV